MSDIVVSAEWLADRIESDAVVVVDVRDPWEFEGIGHLPGAVNVPFDEYRSEFEGEAGHLPGAEVFEALMREAGITNEDELVAYDDTHGVFAARFVVTAELYGHDRSKLHLLDGDFSAWSREYEISRETAETELDTGDSGAADYDAVFQTGGPLITIEEVQAATEDPDAVLVDNREAWEYEEGHIPGAVRLDWRELVDEESRGLKTRPELETILEERGIRRDRRVILYCNTARRISHTYVVLRYLDYEDLAFYEGSLTEWEREGGEVESG